MSQRRAEHNCSSGAQSPPRLASQSWGAIGATVVLVVSLVAVGGVVGPVTADSSGVQSEATEGPLTVLAQPGTAGQENTVAFGFNASTVTDERDVLDIRLNFSEASGVTTTEIAEDQVTIQGEDTGTPSPDSTTAEGPGVLLVTSSDTFTLANEGGLLWVNVTGVELPTEGTFDAGIEFLDDQESALVAFGTDQYTVGDGGGGEDPASFDVTIEGTTSPVTEGDTLSVDTQVENTGSESATQTVSLDAGGLGTDEASVALDGGESTTQTLTVGTSDGDAGTYTATVSSIDDTASATVEVTADTAQGPLTVQATPGDSGVENEFTFAFNASGVTDERDVEGIVLDFDEASGVNAAAVSEDDVTIQGESTGTPGVDATSEQAPGVVRVTASDTFTLAAESGVIEVTVVGVTPPQAGTFDAGIEFRDSEADALVATGSGQYTIEDSGPQPIEGESPPQDTDGDDLYEDTNGDGEFTLGDVQLLLENRNSEAVEANPELFDFGGESPDKVTLADIQVLYQLLLGS